MKKRAVLLVFVALLVLASSAIVRSEQRPGKPLLKEPALTNVVPEEWGKVIGFSTDSNDMLSAQYSLLLEAPDGTLRTIALIGRSATVVQVVPRR